MDGAWRLARVRRRDRVTYMSGSLYLPSDESSHYNCGTTVVTTLQKHLAIMKVVLEFVMRPGRIDNLKLLVHVTHQRSVVGEHRTQMCKIVHSKSSDVRVQKADRFR
jgi:hypothetical protein